MDGIVRLLYGNDPSACGSIGANDGGFLREKLRMPGRWRSWGPCGRNRGECAGVARGVWSGVGEKEPYEKVGEEGAVERGELGPDRREMRRVEESSSSGTGMRNTDCADAGRGWLGWGMGANRAAGVPWYGCG